MHAQVDCGNKLEIVTFPSGNLLQAFDRQAAGLLICRRSPPPSAPMTLLFAVTRPRSASLSESGGIFVRPLEA